MDLMSPEEIEKNKQREENFKDYATADVAWALGRADKMVDQENRQLAFSESIASRKQCVAGMLLKAYYHHLDHWMSKFH